MRPDPAQLEQLYAERIAEELGVLSPTRVGERRTEVRRKLRSQRWQRAGRCVVMHSGPLTDDQRLWVAIFSPLGRTAVARESALTMAGVRGVPSGELCVLTEWGRRPPAVTGVLYVQSRHLAAADLVAMAQPPRTTAARAVVDSASRATPDRARTLVAMTVQQRWTTPAEIRKVLDRLVPVRQDVLLRLTLADVEGGAQSLPELRFTGLLRQAHLPEPTRQAARRRADGRYFLDVAWDDYDLVGEIDGSHHRDAGQWEADVLRQDELMIGGDRVLRLLSWWVRDRPELVLDLLRRALRAGGWEG